MGSDSWNRELIRYGLKDCGLTIFERRLDTLASCFLGDAACDEFSSKLFEYMLACGIYGKGENGIWGQLAKEKNQQTKGKQSTKLWYYFPPISYMKQDYRWLEKYPYLIGLAWIKRGIHGLLNEAGREKHRMLKDITQGEVNTYQEI